MRLVDFFEKGLERGRDRIAFIEGHRSYCWGEIDELSRRLAAALLSKGLPDSARVAVYSPNDVMAFVAILAIFRAGAVWVPVNARNSSEANEHWFRVTGCHCLFFHGSVQDKAIALRPFMCQPAMLVRLDEQGSSDIPCLRSLVAEAGEAVADVEDAADRLLSVFPTGGTTGLSKAAEWTQGVWEALVSAYWQSMPSDEPPVHLVAGPMTHAAGVLALLSLPKGATNVVLKKPEPGLILEAISRYRITHLYLPPTLLYMLLAHPEVRQGDYSSLKYMVIAAAPVAPAKLREAMEVFGPVICQSFGQAEAPMFLTFLSTHDLLTADDSDGVDRWASCGRPSLGVRVEIMDENGHILPPHERGEIVARGNLVVPGYYANPEATMRMRQHGWHHTGDIGFKDRAGFVYIVDRQKDMIITGGFNVFSAEVEQVILSLAAVRECAVIGVPDERWGEAVKAVVELKPGCHVEEAEIVALVKERLGGVHAPKTVEFWPELPRSGTGKVLKQQIRARYWASRDRAIG